MISCYSNVPDNWRIIKGDGFPTIKVPEQSIRRVWPSLCHLPTHTCSGSLSPKGEVQQASSWCVKTLQGLKAAQFQPQSPGTAISSPPSTFHVFALSNGHMDCPAPTLSINSFYPCRFHLPKSFPSFWVQIYLLYTAFLSHPCLWVTLSSTSIIILKIT